MPTVIELPGQVEIEFPDGAESQILPILNQYGQFQIGGPLTGHAGTLDKLFEMAPGIGDIRAADRFFEHTRPTVQPDLMGGVKAQIDQPAAMGEALSLAPAGGDIASAVAKILAGGAALPMLGKIVFHGSPHKFSKFDHAMMGSGEGAQAYGWGTYLADNPQVALDYKRKGQQGIGSISLYHGQELPIEAWDEIGPIMRKHDIPGDISPNQTQSGMVREMLDSYGGRMSAGEKAVLEKYALPEGSLYEVDIPDDQIAKMLDWDAPLSEQKSLVRRLGHEKQVSRYLEIDDRLSELMNSGGLDSPEWERLTAEAQNIRRDIGYSPLETGEDLYRRFSNEGGSPLPNEAGQQAASEALNQLGIPGIKYWDGGSRAAGDGTRNYVVFDEDIMTIIKRNQESLR